MRPGWALIPGFYGMGLSPGQGLGRGPGTGPQGVALSATGSRARRGVPFEGMKALMGSSTAPTLVWFRLDLRLADQPALLAALEAGGPVIPVFVWAPGEEGAWAPGAATRWWLHHSLARLDASLRGLGSRLVVRRGPTREALVRLVRETGAARVFWNRRYEPALTSRDAGIKEALREAGVAAESFNSALLNEPWTIRNQSGRPFQVFTPYWRHCLAASDPAAAQRPLSPARLFASSPPAH